MTNIKPAWPENESVQGVLRDLLLAEADERRHPGAGGIADKLVTGEEVLTTPQAEEIWRGGIGNFIKVDRDPPDGVGVISLQLRPDVWSSALVGEW